MDNTDVYAFGAVALEIARGRRAYDPHAKNCDDLILQAMVWRRFRKEELISIADPLLSDCFGIEQMHIVSNNWACYGRTQTLPVVLRSAGDGRRCRCS